MPYDKVHPRFFQRLMEVDVLPHMPLDLQGPEDMPPKWVRTMARVTLEEMSAQDMLGAAELLLVSTFGAIMYGWNLCLAHQAGDLKLSPETEEGGEQDAP